MKTIIIPTDFSPAASNALHYGIEMAKEIGADVLLFHAYQIPVSFTDVPLVVVSTSELHKIAEEKMVAVKKEVEHISSHALKISTEVRLGNTTDELELLCEQIQPFAVVMGSKGSSGLEQMIFGSTTLTVVKHLTWPVICVPTGKAYGHGINKIGLACDFKNVTDTTPTQTIMTFQNEFKASLHVLNVDYRNRDTTPDTPEESTKLHALLKKAKPIYHFINRKDVEDGINEFAEKNNLDLIITIPKKHKLLEGLFKQSTTKQLVFQSHIPVMCVHE